MQGKHPFRHGFGAHCRQCGIIGRHRYSGRLPAVAACGVKRPAFANGHRRRRFGKAGLIQHRPIGGDHPRTPVGHSQQLIAAPLGFQQDLIRPAQRNRRLPPGHIVQLDAAPQGSAAAGHAAGRQPGALAVQRQHRKIAVPALQQENFLPAGVIHRHRGKSAAAPPGKRHRALIVQGAAQQDAAAGAALQRLGLIGQHPVGAAHIVGQQPPAGVHTHRAVVAVQELPGNDSPGIVYRHAALGAQGYAALYPDELPCFLPVQRHREALAPPQRGREVRQVATPPQLPPRKNGDADDGDHRQHNGQLFGSPPVFLTAASAARFLKFRQFAHSSASFLS